VPKFDKKLLWLIILFSIPLFLSGLFSSGMDVVDRFILDHFFGKKEVGEYSFAYRLAMITNIFVISFRTAWIPYALNKFKDADYKINFGKILVKVIAIGVFILLAVSFFADDLFNIKIFDINLFNPIYKGGLIILPFVVIGYIFSSLTAFYSLYPFTVNKSSYFLISDGIGIVSNIILNFILIPIYGLLGAGIATAISFLISFAYLYFISKGKVEVLYMKKEMLIITLSGIIILLIGLNYNIFLVQFVFILSFFGLILYVLKLKPSAFLRILQ
jgi:O-antigen/teichoic acid export membrane protein